MTPESWDRIEAKIRGWLLGQQGVDWEAVRGEIEAVIAVERLHASIGPEETRRHRAAIRQALPDRRERIAVAAMQGLLASEGDTNWERVRRPLAEAAVAQADVLIAQLDEGRPVRPTVHVVTPGETLSGISLRYYGDADRWPALAKVNRLDDPDHIEPGWMIAIPKELP